MVAIDINEMLLFQFNCGIVEMRLKNMLFVGLEQRE